jgi:hypothetical protein
MSLHDVSFKKDCIGSGLSAWRVIDFINKQNFVESRADRLGGQRVVLDMVATSAAFHGRSRIFGGSFQPFVQHDVCERLQDLIASG